MKNTDYTKLYIELEKEYPDGGYVSRATIFGYAFRDGMIDEDTYDNARKYFGSLWNYTGD